ncbi:hypothetical protein [Apilactobacillus timberlakei]|uniref:hypothetical protein n=1 Tax=Apilactobacillus timberlakei TaxID=2008380 RepID=UPI00112C89BE|nr:hypothetical protein [Apilactobacillus timberlakei]TPR16288.1 hypothetical protein DYZ95_07930 [Apilactobacillus timberlakei]TPR21541.1 hypothetical protein DY083_05840 [Apilactobacillus timberlakei]
MQNYLKYLLIGSAIGSFLISGALFLKFNSINQQTNTIKEQSKELSRKNDDYKHKSKQLNQNDMIYILKQQGIVGTDLEKLQNNMSDIITHNLQIAYNAKSDDDFKKINKNQFSDDLINNLIEKDEKYTQGSYSEKHPKFMREGIKNIAIKYGQYDYTSGNIEVIVNVNYNRYSIFNKTWDGSEKGIPNDTYILKCNLKNGFADLINYYAAIPANKDQNSNNGGV